jgi:hypothetical protein
VSRESSAVHARGRTPLRLIASPGSLSFAVQSAFDTQGLVTSLADSVPDPPARTTSSLLLLDYETGELDGQFRARRHWLHGPHAHHAPACELPGPHPRETLVIEDPERIRQSGASSSGMPGRRRP